jgi:RNA polymerase sigma-70 factor (ECF subfamily)
MIKYIEGEYPAFETLYCRHKDRVFSYVRRRIKDSASVEEVFQNIFLKLHRFREKYDPKYLFLQWLYTISRSEVIDFLKKKNMTHTLYDEDFGIGKIDKTSFESMDLIEKSDLGEKEKKALILRYLQEEDYKMIAKTLNVNEAYARKIVGRALNKLKNYFGGNENGSN